MCLLPLLLLLLLPSLALGGISRDELVQSYLNTLPTCDVKGDYPDVFSLTVEGIEALVQEAARGGGSSLSWGSFTEMIQSGKKKKRNGGEEALSLITQWEGENSKAEWVNVVRAKGQANFVYSWNMRNPTVQMEQTDRNGFKIAWYPPSDQQCLTIGIAKKKQ